MIRQPVAPGVEIVRTGSHVAAYVLYCLNRRHGWGAVIDKKQAARTRVAVQLVKPLLYPLGYLGGGIRDVGGIGDRDNVG